MVGKHLPRSLPFNALTLLPDAIASSRWRCRYTNFHQLCDTTLYPKGIKVSDQEIQGLNITRNQFHGEWNYTISPSQQPP